MAFESFDDLARVGLKRAATKSARIVVRSEFSTRTARTQTVFRFAEDLIERAGWTPGVDRIQLLIDRTDMAIRARRVAVGGYKLIGNGRSRPYLKFTAAKGMPISVDAAEATDIVVVANEIMFVLPEGVVLAAN